jgi:hypothetical protein
MSLERVDRLVEIGFQWAIKDPRYVPWETRYDELVAFIVSVRRDQICFTSSPTYHHHHHHHHHHYSLPIAERTWPCTGANWVRGT